MNTYPTLIKGNIVQVHAIPAGYLLLNGVWVSVEDLWKF